MIEVKAFKCEFCSRASVNKGGMVIHERSCRNNPKNISLCASCEHLTRIENIVDAHKETILHCDALDKNMYHRRILYASDFKRDGILSKADTMMPSILEGCEHYNSGFTNAEEFDFFDFL